MTEICEDCSICEKREECAGVNLLICPACGNAGTIQNIFDKHGQFERIVFSKEIQIIEVEGHSVPVCNKCRAMMEPKDREE
jgi:hypothetical protein